MPGALFGGALDALLTGQQMGSDRRDADLQKKLHLAATLAVMQQMGIMPSAQASKYSDAQPLADSGYSLSPSARLGKSTVEKTDEGLAIIDPVTGVAKLVRGADGKPIGAKTFAPRVPQEIKRVPVIIPGSKDPVMSYQAPNGTLTDDDYNVIEGARPYEKPEASANDLTPHPFTLNGKPVQGFTDKQGHFYDPNGQRVAGDIAPYSPPPAPDKTLETIADPQHPDGPGIRVPRSEAIGKAVPRSTGIGGSATAQSQQARLLAAVSEARLADERMRKFEDGLLDGSKTISPLQQAAGSLTTNLSGTHSALGAITQAGSELGLNTTDPDYAQYLRDAATVGRAEQMISPRGGNETMVRANSLLARAGTGAAKNTIDASRMARQALFGEAGGIAQTMTPEQTTKLKQGLDRVRAGNGSPAPTPRVPLPDRVQQLKAMGLSKSDARAQLLQEGYNLGGTP